MGSLVEGMGNSHHIMRTVRPEARWYFNQGIDPPMLRSPQFASKRVEQVELWGFAIFLIRTEEQGAHTACRH